MRQCVLLLSSYLYNSCLRTTGWVFRETVCHHWHSFLTAEQMVTKKDCFPMLLVSCWWGHLSNMKSLLGCDLVNVVDCKTQNKPFFYVFWFFTSFISSLFIALSLFTIYVALFVSPGFCPSAAVHHRSKLLLCPRHPCKSCHSKRSTNTRHTQDWYVSAHPPGATQPENVICFIYFVLFIYFLATAGTSGFNSPANTSRMSLNSSVQLPTTFPSIQLLGLEMLLHYFLGPEVVTTAAKHKVMLTLGESHHYKFLLVVHNVVVHTLALCCSDVTPVASVCILCSSVFLYK